MEASEAITKSSLIGAKRVLKLFQECKGELHQENETQSLVAAERVLNIFKAQGLHHYDIFLKAGFLPNENNLSDAIASLLDPNQGHQLGTKPLECLLKQIKRNSGLSSPDEIISLLRNDQIKISVKRESHEIGTRPDIEIFSEDFLIFIENKVRGGIETDINGKLQTDRQWEALNKKGTKYGIPEERLLGIFLSPEKKPPYNKGFISVSVNELIASIISAIDLTESCQHKNSLRTFLEYYHWVN
jgi:hypothetical protein